MAKTKSSKVDGMLEALNNAIKIHTDNAVKQLAFNKSELVEIVDITERNLGKYIVWNGSAKYYAYSSNTTYPVGAKVYVSIPNNDFSAQKQIIGQYVADGEPGIFYRNPLKSYLPLTTNLIKDSTVGSTTNKYVNNQCGLLANWDLTKELNETGSFEQLIEIYRADNLSSQPENSIHNYQGFKYMGISAEFKSLLHSFSPIAGDYGLSVVVWGLEKNDVTENSVLKKKIFTLDTKDMIGDVYNYSVYFKQASLYDISDFSHITKIIVGFYQRGNFKDNNNNFIPHSYTSGGKTALLGKNLFVKNVNIQFGNDLLNENDSIKIYTLNGETYDPAQYKLLNYKNIHLQWTHLNPTTKEYELIQSINDYGKNGIENVTIHWYQDSIHSQTESYANPTEDSSQQVKLDAYQKWFNLMNQEKKDLNAIKDAFEIVKKSYNLTDNDIDYTKNPPTLSGYAENQITDKITKAIGNMKAGNSHIAADNLAGAGWKSMSSGGSFKYSNFLPDETKAHSRVLCIVEYGPKKNGAYITDDPSYCLVKSNVLQFDNLRMTSNSLSDDKANSLKIQCSDGTDGNYPIYDGTTGNLLSREEFSKERRFTLSCISSTTGEDYLNGNETIIWKIPKINTMILWSSPSDATPVTSSVFKSLTHRTMSANDANMYYYISYTRKNNNTSIGIDQVYRIAQFYNKANTNNTVFCYLIKNKEVFETSKTLTFSQHGTCGTDYTFSLGLIQQVDSDWKVVGPGDTAITNYRSANEDIYWEIGFDLYNSKNEKIDLTDRQKHAIIKPWVTTKANGSRSEDGYYSGLENAKKLIFITQKSNDGKYYTRVAVRTDFSVRTDDNGNPIIGDNGKPVTGYGLSGYRYIVLKAAVTQEVVDTENNVQLGPVLFEQLLPLHFRANNTSYVLRGSDYIIYDDKGANPNCYNDYYQLIRMSDNSIIKNRFRIIVDGKDRQQLTAAEASYYPELISANKIKGNDNNYIDIDYKLRTTPLYIDNISKNIAIECVIGTSLYYTCPLVILQNKYQIPAINSWNGELTVDAQGNKILASMIGAGHKDAENTFTGVLMGDIEQKDSYTAKLNQETGLFGYKKGAQTFGFNTNGEAFIGTSGTGRIYVDGNTGRITSAAREAYDINHYHFVNRTKDASGGLIRSTDDDDPRGTDINLAKNYIDIQGIGSKSRIHLDTNVRSPSENGTNAYFSIDNKDGKRLMHVADDTIYLQTANWLSQNSADEMNPPGTPAGLRLNLSNGTLHSYDKITIKGAVGSKIHFGDTNNYLELGYNGTDKGYLTSTGKINITGDSGSTIKFGDDFKVNSDGKLTSVNGEFTQAYIHNLYVATASGEKSPLISASQETFVTGVTVTATTSTVPVTGTVSGTVSYDKTTGVSVDISTEPTTEDVYITYDKYSPGYVGPNVEGQGDYEPVTVAVSKKVVTSVTATATPSYTNTSTNATLDISASTSCPVVTSITVNTTRRTMWVLGATTATNGESVWEKTYN